MNLYLYKERGREARVPSHLALISFQNERCPKPKVAPSRCDTKPSRAGRRRAQPPREREEATGKKGYALCGPTQKTDRGHWKPRVRRIAMSCGEHVEILNSLCANDLGTCPGKSTQQGCMRERQGPAVLRQPSLLWHMDCFCEASMLLGSR